MRWGGAAPAARLVLCLAALCAMLVTVAGDWPTYLHDATRGAASPDEATISPDNAGGLARLWTFKTGEPVAASPTVAGGTVYAGSWDGYEYALDAATGALKWKTFLGLTASTASHCVPSSGHIGVTSAAAVQDGVVYVGGGDAYWYALDAATGRIRWKVYTGDNSEPGGHYNWSSPLLYHGYAYIGIASLCDNPLVQGQLLKVDLSTQQIVATFKAVPNGQVGGGIWTSPSVDPATNTIFATTGTNGAPSPAQPYSVALVMLDATTLAVKGSWQIPPVRISDDSDWGDTPILFGDGAGNPLVAAINKNGYLYAFRRRAASLEPLWQRRVASGGSCPTCGDGSVSSGAAGAGRLYMAGGTTTIGTTPYSGSVRAFDPATGAILWEHGTARPVIGALAYANGLVADGAGNTLEVLDAATGDRLYSYRAGGAFYGAPSIAEGRIYAGATDGGIYAFGFSLSDTHKGIIAGAGGSDSYTFTPSSGGAATVGSCGLGDAGIFSVYVRDESGTLVGEGATPSVCNWAGVNVTAGHAYTVTTITSGAGLYRSAWSVNGAPQTWSVGGSIAAGETQTFTFPTLSAGAITLSTCGPASARYDLSLLDARGTEVVSATTLTACTSLSYASTARSFFRLRETGVVGQGAWSGTITVGPPSAGSYSGSISPSGSGSYVFVPGTGGPAMIGSCAVDTGALVRLSIYGADGRLLGAGTSSSYCDWASITVAADQPYTATTIALVGSGAYRSAWSVQGAQVVWNAFSSIATEGGSGSFSFPTLGNGPISLSTCGPDGADFNLSLASANGVTLASSTSPSACEALTYTPSARGLFRLQESAVSGSGPWFGAISTY